MNFKNEKEVRSITDLIKIETRADEGIEKKIIVGYALKFNSWSKDLGGFIEMIDRKALDKCDMSDVRCLVDHYRDKILGRTTNSTLKLYIDDIGLRYECTPSNTTYAQDLIINMENGNINQCSFNFRLNWENPDCETWEYDEERKLYKRVLKDIKMLFDVSPVTYPAYTNTECVVAQRGLENYRNDLDMQLKKQKLFIELELAI